MRPRPPRAVRVDALELEGRLLLASLPVASVVAATPKDSFVQFDGPTPGTPQATLFVPQQAGRATVSLLPSVHFGRPFQVEVTTDPSSPAVGVNAGAVDQTVTLARRHPAYVTVPILAGAPNPGEVDVTLTARPVNPPAPVTVSNSMVLRIVASYAMLPPTITNTQKTRQGIVLTFSKPMDPASAANVHNYSLVVEVAHFHAVFLSPGEFTYTAQLVPLRAAMYDPATNSVTLVPTRSLTSDNDIHVTAGSGSKKSSRPGHPSDAPLGLTDLEGNPINGNTSPGRFNVTVGMQGPGFTVFRHN